MNPRWVGYGGEGVSENGLPVPRREGVGIFFDCPCGKPGCRCSLLFRNPLDGGPQVCPDHPSWQRTGDTFASLTLDPSIQRADPGGCRWHGFLRNGEFINA
jgi:hypothetical protein